MRTFTVRFAVAYAACTCAALSQTSRGAVTGTVLDPTGAYRKSPCDLDRRGDGRPSLHAKATKRESTASTR